MTWEEGDGQVISIEGDLCMTISDNWGRGLLVLWQIGFNYCVNEYVSFVDTL